MTKKDHWVDRRHRNPKDARSKFERWVIEQGGTMAVAKMLDMHHVTVSCWLSQKFTPNLATAILLIEKSKGELTLEDILEGTSK